jgi:hypothetical protein
MARKSKDKSAMDANRNGAMTDAAAPAEDSSGAGAGAGAGGGGGVGKLLLLLILAAMLAMVLSKDARSKVLDMLFGSEEEFDYSSTTMPATEAPVGAGAS